MFTIKHTCFHCRKDKHEAAGDWYSVIEVRDGTTPFTNNITEAVKRIRRWICHSCWRKSNGLA